MRDEQQFVEMKVVYGHLHSDFVDISLDKWQKIMYSRLKFYVQV